MEIRIMLFVVIITFCLFGIWQKNILYSELKTFSSEKHKEQLSRVKLTNQNLFMDSNSMFFEASTIKNFKFDWVEAYSTNWKEMTLKDGEIRNLLASGSAFSNVTFKNVYIDSSQFRKSKFKNCVFKNVMIENTGFDSVFFENVHFQNVVCDNCSFVGAKFFNSTFDGKITRGSYSLRSKLPFPIEKIGYYDLFFINVQ